MLTMDDIDLTQKRVLLREDLNVPMHHGQIQNDARIKAILPTLKALLAKKAGVILLSHVGRPTEGVFDVEASLKPIADHLQTLLHYPVRFEAQWLDGVECKSGDIVLCENVRFNVGEEKNDPHLAKRMAALGDVFVMDAFGTAHRAQASTVGLAQFSTIAVAGPLLVSEMKALDSALQTPKRPLLAIVGGAKISGKLEILISLIEKVDVLMVGGGIANTFLAALGFNIGASMVELELVATAKKILQDAHQKNVNILLPEDVVVAETLSEQSVTRVSEVASLSAREKIADVGPNTLKKYQEQIAVAGTIVWNGPLGIFEYPPFERGTRGIAEAIARSDAFSLAGGGETLAAIDKFKVSSGISYISTGGGAFLEYLEGQTLPVIKILQERSKERERKKE